MSLQYTKTHTVVGYTSGDLDIPFTFDYLDDTDIKVYRTDTSSTPLVLGTDWQFKNKKEITLLSANVSPAIQDGNVFLIQRETQVNNAYITYAPGSAIRAEDLNSNQQQALFAAQEREERTVSATGDTFTGNLIFSNADIVFYGANTPTSNPVDNNETTLTAVEPTQDNTVSLPNVTGFIPVMDVAPTAQITSTPAEINTLDGITASTQELNYSVGVTSAIQTQLNNKQPLDAELTELATMDANTASSLADLTSTEVQLIDGLTTPTADLNLIQGLQATSAELNTLSGITSSTTELNKLTSVNTTAAEFNKLSGLNASTANLDITNNMTKSTTLVSTSDTEYPTSKAVADYVTTQLSAIDGFVAVADKSAVAGTTGTAVPSGVTISIADAGGIPVDSSGTATYTSGSGQVTITGIASPFRPSVGTLDVDAGVRFLIEGTGTAGSYTYHGSALKEQDLVNLSSDINDFGERYRVFNAGKNSDSDTSNHAGDLCFDVPAGKMFVYDAPTQVAGSGSWGEVQSVGDFILIPDSELANFTGSTPSATTTITNAPAVAQQIMLVINGVIQKASTGTGTPTEGFTLSGGTITLAAAPPANSSVFGIILGSSVNVPVVGAGTVNTLQLADFGVTNVKLHNTAGSEAVNTNVIRTNAVTDVKLASDASTDANRAVGQNHIKTQAVTAAKLSPSLTGNGNKFLRLNAGATDLEYADVPAPSISNASTFTGDNSTTQFTIVTGHTVHSILVVMNGLVLRPTTDYTVSGTTLTFTTAPGTGDEIDVRYLPI